MRLLVDCYLQLLLCIAKNVRCRGYKAMYATINHYGKPSLFVCRFRGSWLEGWKKREVTIPERLMEVIQPGIAARLILVLLQTLPAPGSSVGHATTF